MATLTLPARAHQITRHDIVSAILDTYTSRDDDGTSTYSVSPILSPYRSASPMAKEKPMPPMLGLQLRVEKNATTREVEKDRPIISRSISRSSRPPRLKLTTSNGSTAESTSATSSSTRNATTVGKPDERPLPDLPPPPPAKSHLRAAMGNKLSKPDANIDEPSTTAKRTLSHNLFKRRPIAGPKPAASSTTIDQPQPPPPNGTAPEPAHLDGAVDELEPASSEPARQRQRQSQAQSQRRSDSTISTEHDSDTTPTNPDSADQIEDSGTPATEVDPNSRPSTPHLKSTLLPPPTPIPEESPSKYGIGIAREAPREARIEAPAPPVAAAAAAAAAAPAAPTAPTAPLQRPGHMRGKSSTGFDIFKQTVARQREANTFDPAAVSPTAPATAQQVALADPQLSKNDAFIFRFNSHRPIEPPTNAPPLRRVHLNCFHNHAKFHRSRNNFVPVDCMLCFGRDSHDHWTCTWCCLRICGHCRGKLEQVERKSIELLLHGRTSRKSRSEGDGRRISNRRCPEVIVSAP